jgi:hypothetical protein
MVSHRRADRVIAQAGPGTAGGAPGEGTQCAFQNQGLSRDSAPTCVRPEGG